MWPSLVHVSPTALFLSPPPVCSLCFSRSSSPQAGVETGDSPISHQWNFLNYRVVQCLCVVIMWQIQWLHGVDTNNVFGWIRYCPQDLFHGARASSSSPQNAWLFSFCADTIAAPGVVLVVTTTDVTTLELLPKFECCSKLHVACTFPACYHSCVWSCCHAVKRHNILSSRWAHALTLMGHHVAIPVRLACREDLKLCCTVRHARLDRTRSRRAVKKFYKL